MIKLLQNSLTTKYFQFSGRANRKEYWVMYLLGFILIRIVYWLTIFKMNIVINNFYLILFLIFVIAPPFITVLVRRLHDINFSSWWFLTIIFFEVWGNDFFNNSMKGFVITIIPDIIVGFIKGTPTTNKYGEPPINSMS